MARRVTQVVGLSLMVIGVALLVIAWPWQVVAPATSLPVVFVTRQNSPTPTLPPATPSDAPVVPTATSTPMPTSTFTSIFTPATIPSATKTPARAAILTRAVPSPTVTVATRAPTSPPLQAATAGARVPLWQGRARLGVIQAMGPITRYRMDQLGAGWYLNWHVSANPARPDGIEYVQMIRVRSGVLDPDAQTIAAVARSLPGSLWLVGNEPDRVTWQDSSTPVQYAMAYSQAYHALKRADLAALVATAGVVQPTPLRLRYLDAVLTIYQQLCGEPMPADVWNVHNFILREERGSWGAEIPPGLSDSQGVLRQVDDNDNLDIFKSQIWAFRRWMRDRGQQNKPLIISEYGVLMPPDYGFGPERVRRFLNGTFDFFLSASDPSVGYPPDGNRLVQRWCWYSLSDTQFPAGNLFDPQTFQMTALGQAWRAYVARQ